MDKADQIAALIQRANAQRWKELNATDDIDEFLARTRADRAMQEAEEVADAE